MAVTGVSISIEFRPLPGGDLRDLSMQELLELCLSPESPPEAWEELVRRIKPRICAAASRSLRRWTTPTRDKVDDLAQRTLLKLYTILSSFTFVHENAFFKYLSVMTFSVGEDVRRETHRKSEEGLDGIDPHDPAPSPDGRIFFDQALQYLRRKNVTEQDVQVFLLHYRFGLTAKAISELPGIALGKKQVEYTLYRLIQLLKTWCRGKDD